MIGEVLEIGGKLIDKLFPDPADKMRAQAALLDMQQRGELQELAGRIEIVKTEAQSDHWLAANWRPLCMLIFTGLIVARWMGWSAPGMSEAEALKLWSIVEVGLGGYVVGRTAEKVLPPVAGVVVSALKK